MTRLRLVDPPPEGVSWYDPEPGDVWPCPSHEGSHDVEGRPPCMVIRMPGADYVFHTNMGASTDGTLWDVTGEPPTLTVHPSIAIGPDGSIWHGWITNGEMNPA